MRRKLRKHGAQGPRRDVPACAPRGFVTRGCEADTQDHAGPAEASRPRGERKWAAGSDRIRPAQQLTSVVGARGEAGRVAEACCPRGRGPSAHREG